jgi:integrase
MALERDATPGARALQCIALVGQRAGEVTGASARELVEEDWWEIPGARTKNRRAHLVYLVPRFRELVGSLEEFNDGSDYWFPGRVPGEPIKWLNKIYLRAREASSVDFAPKDLRATFTTGLSRLGIRPEVKSACLNHTPQDVTSRHYDKWHYSPEKQEAFTVWANHVASVVSASA